MYIFVNTSGEEQNTDLDTLPPQIRTQLEIDQIEFVMLDENKDDRLSKTEMMAPVDSAVLLDANKDGKLNRREMVAVFKPKPGRERLRLKKELSKSSLVTDSPQ